MFLLFLVNVLVFDLKLYLKHFNVFMFRQNFQRESQKHSANTCVQTDNSTARKNIAFLFISEGPLHGLSGGANTDGSSSKLLRCHPMR